MEEYLHFLLDESPFWVVLALLVGGLLLLTKGADLLVDEAVALSERLRIPTVIIGATVVSLGTTLPETTISVMAALQGAHDIALGNAVGSIICDTGLILGLGALLRPLPLDRRVVNKQGWLQFGAGLLLVLLCLPWASLPSTLTEGGRLPQGAGFFLVTLLLVYIGWSIRSGLGMERAPETIHPSSGARGAFLILLRLAGGIALVVLSSKVVIPSGKVLALRAGVPPEVVSASLIAFGTSLPELVTVIGAVLKGRGELAVGNVIGADILNVLFVAGVSAAVTPGGLAASPVFFSKFFPFMVGLLLLFRVGIWTGGTHLSRSFGALLIAVYGLFLYLNFL